MPKAVEECVRSVLADNPEYSESRAYAICNAMRNRNELEVSDNPSHDELLTAAAQQEIDCPEGHVHTGSQCVPIEEVRDVPPSILNSEPAVFQLAGIETEPIERVEEGENKIRYKNIKILQAGVWTDSSSKRPVWYSPEGLSNMELTEDNVVNIMHDDDNDVSSVGQLDKLRQDSDALFSDLVLDTSTPAGQYADQNMQQTLESEGAKGFGGPSVEIPPGGQKIGYNESKGVQELKAGKIDGLGLVSNPASKPTSFARQAGSRAVALSESDQEVMHLKEERRDMADVETYREVLESNGVDTGEMSDDEIMALYESLMEASESEGEGEEEQEMQEGEEEDDPEDGEAEDEPPEEEEEMDMETKIQSLEERLTNLEDMAEQAMAAEDAEEMLSEELEDAREELADAETVAELSEAKEELEKRLSDLEEEPEDPKTLSDGEGSEDVNRNAVPVSERDGYDGTIRR